VDFRCQSHSATFRDVLTFDPPTTAFPRDPAYSRIFPETAGDKRECPVKDLFGYYAGVENGDQFQGSNSLIRSFGGSFDANVLNAACP
jgi:hypothetical protein